MTIPEWLGAWGRPPDDVSKAAVGAAAALALAALTGRGARSVFGLGETPMSRRVFLWLTSFVAALLSIIWIAEYLRGGPRIIDATTYYLQGRVMSEGSIAWTPMEPASSFRGRFLLYDESAGTLAGIFPPGYPLLLAFGFAFGAPMIVGPALAAAIVVATYRLARTVAEQTVAPELVEPVARGAALVSVACAALRYHTADTMAHGATALFVALAFDSLLRARAKQLGNVFAPTDASRKQLGNVFASTDARANTSANSLPASASRYATLGGLALGMVAATRPFSALPVAIVGALLLRRVPRLLLRAALGTMPGIAFLAIAQHAATGAWFTSSQRMYYATSDGPPGCFTWGFGKDVGCLVEHPDFVKARLPHGYGALAALLVTLRRLRMHLLDIANLEPLALLVLVPRRSPAVLASLALVALQVLAYAPFYFDGNYPGGGARFFVDVLPVEHVLLVLAVARFASVPDRLARGATMLVAIAVAGFGVHAAFDHVLLRDRDGGRPMFEPDVLARQGVNGALVFVDTDHAFGLAYDPGIPRPHAGVMVARLHNDDRDRILFDHLDRPPTFQYHFDLGSPGHPPGEPSLVPWSPPVSGETLRFEAEAEWPPLAQRGGFAEAVQGSPCASQNRVLAFVPWPTSGDGEVTIEIPVPETGRWSVSLRVQRGATIPGLDAVPNAKRAEAHVGPATFSWIPAGSGCVDVESKDLELTAPAARLTLAAHGGAVALDKISLRRSK
ncbi:MAG TPA: hypothetical protein VIF62_22010 [Labilithrix sp.]|jgi:hypothetical protein